MRFQSRWIKNDLKYAITNESLVLNHRLSEFQIYPIKHFPKIPTFWQIDSAFQIKIYGERQPIEPPINRKKLSGLNLSEKVNFIFVFYFKINHNSRVNLRKYFACIANQIFQIIPPEKLMD